ncbi:unnamed protein product [Boreogadus saida]
MLRKTLAWANKEVETFVCILGEEDVVYDVYVAAAAVDIRPTTKGTVGSGNATLELSVSVASLARPGQFGHLGEVCCYGTGRYGTDANEPTRAHARLRNLSWMTYSQCDDHGHNKGDEPSFPLNDNLTTGNATRDRLAAIVSGNEQAPL